MKIVHKPEIDYLSIDFKDEVEAKSLFMDGIIVRQDKKGNVIGIDITDSMKLLLTAQFLTLQEVSQVLGISESTIRRKVRNGEIPFSKPNKKDYRFKKKDILKILSK